MGLKHFRNLFVKKDEDVDSEYVKKVVAEGTALKLLTNNKGFSIIKHIISELEEEYISLATNNCDYAPMYGREALRKLLEAIENKIKEANSYNQTAS